MWSLLFPEWDDMGPGRKAVGLLAAAVGGVASGLSGTSSVFFYLFNTWGAVSGAITFGAEHRTRRDALLRAVASGVLYAAGLIAALHATGNVRVAAGPLLPDSDVLLFLMMAGVSFPLHLLGMRIRNALSPRPDPAPAAEPVAPAVTRRERLREPALR